jgi:cytochrome c oxidase subunit III
MQISILFLALLAAIAGWWLLNQKLDAKPWMEEGIIGDFDGTGAMAWPAAKIGLGVFLAVVGSLFALLVSAYFMRSGYADWRAIPVPQLLWVNTGALILGSIALQAARGSANRRNVDAVRSRLLAAGILGVVFLVGQLWAWKQLTTSGHFVAGNVADSFFYLITGLHGLHVIGGMVALGWTVDKAWRSETVDELRLNIELSAIYWHFLLVIWLILFSLITGLAEDFGTICRQLLT